MSKVVFIVGPTASGKTDASFLLACRMPAEIVSCDSMLIYKEPKIITSKPPEEMLKKIIHYFVGDISVTENFSVFDYFNRAREIIAGLDQRRINTIVCGGSGLYTKALLDGIFSSPGKDETLRKQLAAQAEIFGSEYLFEKLGKIDPKAAEKISANDLRRIIRALEVYYKSGKLISDKKNQASGLWDKLAIKIFGFTMRRALLYEQINQRVDEMFSNGAVDEVQQLLRLNLSLTAEKIIGIKEIKDFIEGKVDEKTARENMKRNTRRFAKRQMTWFKRDKRIEWIDVEELNSEQIADKIWAQI